MIYLLDQPNKKYSQLNPTLLRQNNILDLYKKQPSLKQRSIKREIRSGCGIQKRESLLMLKEVHDFGLDPSELEESQSMMPTIFLHQKEEGAHYQLVDTSLNPIKDQRLDFTVSTGKQVGICIHCIYHFDFMLEQLHFHLYICFLSFFVLYMSRG